MEKVKITKEQEKLVKTLKEIGWNDFDILTKYKNFNWVYDCLKTLEFDELYFVLNDHYEVEQPFEVGDYVYEHLEQKYFKITNVTESGAFSCIPCDGDYDYTITIPGSHFEKVTDPWKIMLLNEGRDKPELKVGDVYVTDKFNVTRIKETSCLDSIKGVFDNNQVVMFFPIESGIEVKG